MVLSECGGDKAPGLDGFNFSFVCAAWNTLKKVFIEMLSKFHRRGKLKKELNVTLLTLIPKVPNPI